MEKVDYSIVVRGMWYSKAVFQSGSTIRLNRLRPSVECQCDARCSMLIDGFGVGSGDMDGLQITHYLDFRVIEYTYSNIDPRSCGPYPDITLTLTLIERV